MFKSYFTPMPVSHAQDAYESILGPIAFFEKHSPQISVDDLRRMAVYLWKNSLGVTYPELERAWQNRDSIDLAKEQEALNGKPVEKTEG